jgi:hypothetical protein
MATSSNDAKNKLDTIQILGFAFYVDHARQELRQRLDPSNRIPFETLKKHQTDEGISLVFDRITTNIYKGKFEQDGLPIATERIVLSSSLLLDPNREQQPQSEQQPAPQQQQDTTRQWKQGDWQRSQPKQKITKTRSIKR